MILTDEQMRQAWSRFTTEQIKTLPDPSTIGARSDDNEKARKGRQRILAIRASDGAGR